MNRLLDSSYFCFVHPSSVTELALEKTPPLPSFLNREFLKRRERFLSLVLIEDTPIIRLHPQPHLRTNGPPGQLLSGQEARESRGGNQALKRAAILALCKHHIK